MTIGYGTRSIKGTCHVGTFILLMQSLVGIFIDALSLGLIFARITDPQHRTRSVFVSVGVAHKLHKIVVSLSEPMILLESTSINHAVHQ